MVELTDDRVGLRPEPRATFGLPSLEVIPREHRLKSKHDPLQLAQRLMQSGVLEPVVPREDDDLSRWLERSLKATAETRFTQTGQAGFRLMLGFFSDCNQHFLALYTHAWEGCDLEQMTDALSGLDRWRLGLHQHCSDQDALVSGLPKPPHLPSLNDRIVPDLVHHLNRLTAGIAPTFSSEDALDILRDLVWEDSRATPLMIEAREALEYEFQQRGETRSPSDEEIVAYADGNLLTPNAVRKRLGWQHQRSRWGTLEQVGAGLERWATVLPKSAGTEITDAALEAFARLPEIHRLLTDLEPHVQHLRLATRAAWNDQDHDPFEGKVLYPFVVVPSQNENDLVEELWRDEVQSVLDTDEHAPGWSTPLDTAAGLEAAQVFLELAPKVVASALRVLNLLRLEGVRP